jgi:hypothetical protein
MQHGRTDVLMAVSAPHGRSPAAVFSAPHDHAMEAAVVSYDWRIAGEMAVRTARARHHRRNGFEWALRFIPLIGSNDG